jgi:hypothetical protein
MLAIGAIAVAGAPAAAREEQKDRDCTGPARWRLEVENEDRGLQVDLRIRDARPGSHWHIVLKQEGDRFLVTDRTANDKGEIRIRRQRPNMLGPDLFRFRATGPGDQACRGTLEF